MEKNDLKQVILDQEESFCKKRDIISREVALVKYISSRQIIIISGVRRSGKSTLLRIIWDAIPEQDKSRLYLNFDDDRLVDFGIKDFQMLYELFLELKGAEGRQYLFLDEAHNVQGWEKFANRMHESGIKVFITGSNAKLLESEISSSLTGRNMLIRLFPFSFREYLQYKRVSYKDNEFSTKEKSRMLSLFGDYMVFGGFPLIIEEENPELLQAYFQDIVNKDIIIRFNIGKVKEFKLITNYLLSHCTLPYSYHTLQQISGIKSLSTIKNFIAFSEMPYLFFNVARFDYSLKKQIYNQKKVYCIDNGFISQLSFKNSANEGRLLENLVFIELIRIGGQVYYHKGKKECDFIVKDKDKITQAIQVCSELNNESEKREVEGLLEARKTFSIKEGIILTYDQEKEITFGGEKIRVIPVWKWLLQQ